MNNIKRTSMAVATILVASLWHAGQMTALAGPGQLMAAGSMSTQRSNHTATLLANGTVLVAGGQSCLFIADGGGCDLSGTMSLASAEIFRPDGTWSLTDSMSTSRYGHTATRLADGRVLVAGGFYEPPYFSNDRPGYLSSAELYDPSTGHWSPTGDLPEVRAFAMATLLLDGTVLVAGGTDGVVDVTAAALKTAEIFHPDTGMWSPTGSMAQAHEGGTLTRLADGKVLVAGGNTTSGGTTLIPDAELYDPASGLWMAAGTMVVPRVNHSATLLSDGTVLVAGGDPMGSAEIFNPSTRSWASTASTLNWHGPSAVLLADGTVLLADSVAEVYDPIAHAWSSTSGTIAQSGQSATRLLDERVLVAGGCCDPVSGLFLSSAQIYGGQGVTDPPLTATGRSLTTWEGTSFYDSVAAFNDADPNGIASQFSAIIDWNDGTSSPGTVQAGTSGFRVFGGHTYIEEGSFNVAVSIMDSGGAATRVTSTTVVADNPVAVSGANTTLTAREGVAKSLTLGMLKDADPNGTATDYAVTVAWGDGTSSAGSITASGSSFLISGTHTYQKPGQYTITVTGRDVGGATATVHDSINVTR